MFGLDMTFKDLGVLFSSLFVGDSQGAVEELTKFMMIQVFT